MEGGAPSRREMEGCAATLGEGRRRAPAARREGEGEGEGTTLRRDGSCERERRGQGVLERSVRNPKSHLYMSVVIWALLGST
jgi:hypothetical protein